jgi:hypothetical protein
MQNGGEKAGGRFRSFGRFGVGIGQGLKFRAQSIFSRGVLGRVRRIAGTVAGPKGTRQATHGAADGLGEGG